MESKSVKTKASKARLGKAKLPVARKATTLSEEDIETNKNSQSSFPIVGIGASAGGLAAFEAFFSGMPTDSDPNMAFVLVQHLAPDHKSILTELIRRYTRMQVFEVQDGMVVQPNCAYIIPPNKDMAFLNGTLQLLEPSAPRGQRLPIDFFFRSLAQDQHERAIGIILSGTGSDGSQGVRAIKGEGGMVMAQTPATTEFDGMPRSALITGLVDYELPPEDMAKQLIAYSEHAFLPSHLPVIGVPKAENAMKKVFIMLRTHTGNDFSQYKPSTIYRRIERRMAVHLIKTMDSYVKYLQETPAEVEALFRDMLIGVTSFFRDPEAFQVIETQVIPKLFAGKTAEAAIRIWCAGCSTGEEAYSFAILLAEQQERQKQKFRLQVFATDLDSQSIAIARTGLYPASIAADISPERLARFFTTEPNNGGYRINKSIRDMLVFSVHNIIKDPPFSKLDFISCRNLLIYFNIGLHKKMIPLFHFAMNPGAFLFLGTSETIGEFDDLFLTLDRKEKLYQRKDSSYGTRLTTIERFAPQPGGAGRLVPTIEPVSGASTKTRLRELTEQALLKQVAPSAALVNAKGDILFLHGRTGMFLEPAPGEFNGNILKMAREGLRSTLAPALHKAVANKELVINTGLRVKTNGDFSNVTLTICPVDKGRSLLYEEPLYLVIMAEASASYTAQPNPAQSDRTESGTFGEEDFDTRIEELKQELRAKEEYLQTANEELESSNEELKSSNEELQSVNEEMQSTNEELETSKEELQSVNEELATVNTELQTKVIDLSRAINDMNNLLAGTNIATIFVDHQLRILRFTPTATRIINLIQSDVGRPVSHLASNLVGYNNMVADVRAVLDTLVPKEVEVQISEGKWYNMSIQPYRTTDNVIEGAVITFMDISEIVHARETLKIANSQLRLAVVVLDSYDAITVQDLDGRILAWNPGAVRMYGWSEAEALNMKASDRIPTEQRVEALAKLQQLSRAEILVPYITERIAKDGSLIRVSIISTALINKEGQMYAIATTERAVNSRDLKEGNDEPQG